MVDKVDEYDPTKKSGRLRPQSKTTLKQRMAKATEYSDLDPKLRRKIKENNLREKYNSLSDTQKKSLQGIKTAAEVASYFLPGGALRLAVPIVRGIQAAKTGFKVGKNTYKTLKEATAAKNKLKKVIPSKIKTKNPQTGKQKATPDTKKTTEATKQLKSQTTRNLKAQQKALQARQNKTTKILKGSSNVGLGIGAAAAAEKFRNKKTIIKNRRDAVTDELGKVGEPKSQKKVNKRKPRTEQEKRLSRFAFKNTADTNRKQNSNGIAAPSKASTKRPASVKAGSGKGLGTLSQIASKYGTTVKELMKANKDITNADVIQKGQKIELGKVVKNRKSVYQKKSGGPVVKKMGGGKVYKNMGGLVGGQTKLDMNKDGMITRQDFKMMPKKKKMGGGKVYRRGGGRALRGMGKAIYSNKMY